MSDTVLYFGAIGRAGHYVWMNEHQTSRDHWNAVGPWKQIDGALTPGRRSRSGRLETRGEQGDAALHHKDGWTALAFHDFTVDERGGSNSAFFVHRADLTADEVLDAARAVFPRVVERVGEITVRAGGD